MGKKRKHEQNGKISMPRDQMPLKESSDISPSSFCDVLIQFKDIIKVKVNTDERLQKLEEKVKKIKNKSKEDRSVLKEFVKLVIQEEMQKLEEKIENKSKEDFSVFKADLKKELNEVKEEPDLDIQEEMQKEVCAKVHQNNASPSLRSQPHQSQTPRFRLAIKSKVRNVVYKGKDIRTDDCEGQDHIEVVLYDGGNPIAPDHHLASAAVELAVVDGQFSECTQGFWSKDDFEKSIIKPRQGNPRLVKDGRFILAGGKYRHKGAVITDNSNRKDVKLGVMIVGDTEERVLEGLSNPFRVQEAKTEIRHALVSPLPIDRLQQQHTTQQGTTQLENRGQGWKQNFPPTGQMRNLPVMQNPSQRTYAQTAGEGRQRSLLSTRQMCNFPITQNPSQRTYEIAGGQLPVDHLHQQNTTQQGATQLENHVQGWQHSVQPTGQACNFPITQNPSQRIYAQTTGKGLDGQLLVDQLQQENTIQQGTTQRENHAQGQQHSVQPTGQACNFLITQNASQRIYAKTTGNGLDGQLPVDQLQQQNTTQQGATQLEYHAQGRQHSVQPTGQACNFLIMQNASQRIYAKTTGNGLDEQLLVDQLQQQNTTQQGATQLENHAQGQQHSVQPTGQACNFPISQNPSQRIYAHTTGKSNGLDVQLPVDQLQPHNTTQQGATQLENHAQGQQHSVQPTGQSCNFPITQNPSQRIYAQTTGNGLDGQLRVNQLQQQNTTQHGTTQLGNHGSSTQIRAGDEWGGPLGEAVRPFAPSRGRSADHPATPDDLEYSRWLQHAVAADPGAHSAGTQQWGRPTHVYASISQLNMDCSAGLQLPGPHPQTEDEDQDGGAILCAPPTAAPAPERTQMDFTQATAPAFKAPREP